VLANNIILAIYGAVNLCTNPGPRFGIWQGMFDFGSDWPSTPGSTPSRNQVTANQVATIAAVRQAATIGAAATSSEMDFASLQDALAIRDIVTGQLEIQMDTCSDDTLYTALADLRAAVVRDIAVRGADLALIVPYTPLVTVPALVLAHRLYGDATRADDIITRNQVRNPEFIPGGRPLEVLTNA